MFSRRALRHWKINGKSRYFISAFFVKIFIVIFLQNIYHFVERRIEWLDINLHWRKMAIIPFCV